MYFRFKQKNFKTWLQEFGMALGVSVTKNQFEFPRQAGNGYCLADSIDKSFSFVLMDAELKETFVFDRVNNNQNGLVIFFNQVQFNDHIRICSKREEVTDTFIKDRKNIFISSSTTDIQVTYSAGTKLKRLGIYLAPQWLDENLNADAKTQLQYLCNQKLQQVNQFLIDSEIQNRLNCIFQTAVITDQDKLQLKNKVLNLLDQLFNMYLKLQSELTKKQVIPQDDIVSLQRVETILKDEEIDKFPTILNLAKIAHMSGTKLKVRFKQVYGYRLYEFYNKQRLEKAKLLIEHGITAKEAAYSIGFNDVSNFTKAFKKEYGFTPGRIFDKPTA